jgi:hypothetical protein
MPRPSVTWWGILCLVVPMGICNAVHAVEAGDTCATAGVIAESGSYNFDTTGASGDDPCGVNIPTVWYKFTAPEDGFLGMYLCGSTFDTFLSVFSGISCPESCSGVVQGSEDFCGAQSAVRISVTVGMTYYFAVSGSRPSDFGPGIMRFSYAPARPGLTCADAVPVTRNGSYPFTTHGAPPSDPCYPSPAVWYRFLAPSSGNVKADVCGSLYNTYLTVFDGPGCPASCSGIITTNDNGCGTQSSVTFGAIAGQTYYICVSGSASTDYGDGVFNFDFAPAWGDLCEQAGVLLGSSSVGFDLALATAGDDPCDSPLFRTLWYRFTAPEPGNVRVDTCGSSFDTFVQAFISSGCPVSCYDRVAARIEPCGENEMILPIKKGQTVYFSVGGASTMEVGPGIFTLEFSPPMAGDTCDKAGFIPETGHYAYDTAGASADDPCANDLYPSVWYRFNALENGMVLVRLNETSYTPHLRVFSRSDCPTDCTNVIGSGVPSTLPAGYLHFLVRKDRSYHLSVSKFAANEPDGPGVMEFIFVPYGSKDFNGDGVINVADVTLLGRLIDGGAPLPVSIADFDNDEDVDMMDVQALADFIANPRTP